MPPSPLFQSAPTAPSGLAGRLKDAMRNVERGPGQRLTLLGLEPARCHFAADWDRVTAKVHGIITAVLRGAIGEGEAFVVLDDLSYALVLMPRPSGEHQQLMDRISTDIATRLTGQGSTREMVSLLNLVTVGDGDTALAPPSVGERHSSTPVRQSHLERIVNSSLTDHGDVSLERLSVAFWPVLSSESMAASAWMCVPELHADGLPPLYGYAAVPPHADPAVLAEMDAMMVEAAANALKEIHLRSRVILLPVHRATLALKKYREMYVRICRSLLGSRKDHVIFDIHGIEEGTPTTRIAEYMQWLRPFSRAIGFTIGPDFGPLSVFSGTNTMMLGHDVSGVEPELAAARLAKAIPKLKAVCPRCHVHGIDNRAVADLCLRQGADFLTGPLITPELADGL